MKETKTTKERVRLFRIVRDIPYYIGIDNEQDYSCATNPAILEALFKSIGLKVQRVLCSFKWENLNLPKNLIEIPHNSIETHEYLQVFVPETKKWAKIDPTWDSKIINPTFPIAEWDGLNDTLIAVPTEQIWSVKESKKLSAQEDENKDEYLNKNKNFFIAFNKWLESQRKKI